MIAELSFALALTASAQSALLTTVKDAYPTLSADGKTLLFESTRSGRWALYIAALDGSKVKLLLDTGDDPVTPTWAPGAKHIAYVATVRGSTEIFVIHADGSGRKQLTDARGDDEHPHWAADGRIYWDSGRSTPDLSVPWSEQFQEVYSMRADGSDVHQHTHCKALCTFASMAPDGTHLLYRKVLKTTGVNWDQSASAQNSEIFIADADGGNERNLSRHAAFDGWPVWSPDGQWIAFASNRGGLANIGQIYAIRPDGSALQQITFGGWSAVQPAFAADGGRVYFYEHVESAQTEYGFIGVTEFDPF